MKFPIARPPEFDWDPEKSSRNDDERGLPFDRAKSFDFESAVYRLDDRSDYGEQRIIAIGLIGG
ncbi:BrnT family toxin [Aurantimonas sp. 22II-16-19i]|uniref:BrnT family toxin n=1 Tax=Aurantimonas sp. 22II-16-19i TaxID=1317114 RepID=UPI001FDA3ED4|nr:BrnT family toxin [Aurantimonas sp. 22II-16-19i]